MDTNEWSPQSPEESHTLVLLAWLKIISHFLMVIAS